MKLAFSGEEQPYLTPGMLELADLTAASNACRNACR